MLFRLPSLHTNIAPVPFHFKGACHFHSFFGVFAPTSLQFWDLASDFVQTWAMVACASPYLLLCDILGICFRWSDTYQKDFSAPSLLPRPVFSSPHCGACRVVPWWSSHKYEDGLPSNCKTKGRTESPPGTERRPSNMAPLEIRSKAPMPSLESTVAVSLRSVNVWSA